MKIVIRDIKTNNLIVELFDFVEEGLTEEDINDLIMNAEGRSEEIEELLQNDNYYVSYE